ncbi:MAG: hypothetical protein AABM29_00115 [Actinomycetota bacterium]
MKSLALTIVAAAALAGGLVACEGDGGGGDGGGSKDEFADRANQICTETTRGIVEAALKIGPDTNERQTAELVGAQRPARERGQAKLRRLQPPVAQRQRFARFVALRDEQIEASRRQAEAAEKGDQETAQRTSEQASAAYGTSQKVAGELGLDACALRLPADDATAARAVVKEYETSRDPPRVCRDLVLPQQVEVGFGSYEGCVQFTRERAEDFFATDVKFISASGVDDVAAIIVFEDVGGKYDGVPTQGTVYYVDGRWKIFLLRLLERPNSG